MAQSAPIAAILGGAGFLGRHIVRQGAAQGWRLKLGCRAPAQAIFLSTTPVTGQAALLPARFGADDELKKLVAGADIVINSTGILFQRGGQSFDLLHVEGPARLAELAREAGARHFVHVSALGAGEGSKSHYARSKWQGEQEIKRIFPQAHIVRPSLLFGQGDGFFARFAHMARFSPVLPLIDGGQAQFQPLAVEDAAAAIIMLARGRSSGGDSGKIWELGGAEVYSFKELLEWMLERMGKKRLLMPLPLRLARLAAFFTEKVPFGQPLLTRDQIELLLEGNATVSVEAKQHRRTLAALGITPLALEGAGNFF